MTSWNMDQKSLWLDQCRQGLDRRHQFLEHRMTIQMQRHEVFMHTLVQKICLQTVEHQMRRKNRTWMSFAPRPNPQIVCLMNLKTFLQIHGLRLSSKLLIQLGHQTRSDP